MPTSGLACPARGCWPAYAKPPPKPAPKGFPSELQQRLRAEPPRAGWRIDSSVRPAFLAGDFDGSGKTAYAVPLLEAKSHKDDVLFYLADGKTRRLAHDLGGAVWPGPLWRIVPRTTKIGNHAEINGLTGDHARQGPKLVGDGIEFEKPESSAALVYWSKGRFHIYWTSD